MESAAASSRDSLDVSVVVASHGREQRVATLLDALAAQTLSDDKWELVIVHTYPAPVAASLFEGHALAARGVLRPIAADPARARPSIQRNIGWRTAHAPRIAFTDDDCRPAPDWLERLVAAARGPGAIVQGMTLPDPLEAHRFVHPHFRSLHVEPPTENMETANILYERALLDRVGGLDERAVVGEDIDLGIRTRDAGGRLVPAPDALVYHGVDALSMLEKIRSQFKWQHLAYVVKKHPRLRARCEWRIWWKPEHLRATVTLLALAGAGRRRWMLVGVLPYVALERRRHGPSKRMQVRAIREIPPHWIIELAEVATFVWGSVRYRTVLL